MVLTTTICLVLLLGTQGQSAAQGGSRQKPPRSAASAKLDREVEELRALVDDLRGELRVFKDVRTRAVSEDSVLTGMKLVLAEKQASILREELDRARVRLRRAQESQDDVDYKLENVQPQLIASGGVHRDKTEQTVRTVLGRRRANAVEDEQTAEGEIATIERRLEAVNRYIEYLENRLAEDMEGGSSGRGSSESYRDRVVYGDSSLKVYYSPGCKDLDRIPSADAVRFESVKEAERAGYSLAVDCP